MIRESKNHAPTISVLEAGTGKAHKTLNFHLHWTLGLSELIKYIANLKSRGNNYCYSSSFPKWHKASTNVSTNLHWKEEPSSKNEAKDDATGVLNISSDYYNKLDILCNKKTQKLNH